MDVRPYRFLLKIIIQECYHISGISVTEIQALLPQPVDQIYTTPGNYVVHYSAVQSDALYFLESIEVVSGGCSDNILIGDVDLFYDISDSTGIIQSLSPSNAITQSFPLN